MTKGIGLALVLSLALAAPQTRDAATQIGTSVIAGVVMSDEPSPRPIRRAAVALAFGARFPITTVTDDTGRFVFAGLAAGNYTLVGSKPGWVSSYYGAKTLGRGPGLPIAVLDGQRVTGLTLKMIYGGAITGVVRRPSGQPAVGFSVQVSHVETIGGARRLSLAPANVTTDDRGVYRVFGLAPGDYVVQVSPNGLNAFGGELHQVTPAEVRWADQATAATMQTVAPPPELGPTVAFAPVFYPGTPDASAASAITIAPAEERAGVDFTISMVPTARVSGTLLDENGQPFQGGTISAQPSGAQTDALGILGLIARNMATSVTAAGRFTIPNLTPGQYTLRVRATPRPANGAPPPSGIAADLRMLGGGMPGVPMLWAETDVSVEGRDISDVVLRLQPGMNVTGKIVYDGTAPPPADITQTRVGLAPPPTGTSAIERISSMMIGGTTAKVAADGTFVIAGMPPGKYRASVSGPMTIAGAQATPGPWTLTSAMLNGHDISDMALEIRPNEEVAGLVVTFTDRPTQISGSVIDAAGRPAPGFPILVFSTDRAYWTIGSRRIQEAQPASDGKYVLKGLPPGEYFVCAVTDLTPAQLYDPVFLESVVPGAFKIELRDGEKKIQDLKLAGGQ